MGFRARSVEFLDELTSYSRSRQLMNSSYEYPRRHAITVEEFMRMGEAHVFGYDARLELIEGEIFEMAPISSAHASVVCRLNTLLRRAASGAMVSVQRPLVLSERSMPKPDVMLLRPRRDQYFNSHPAASDTLLAVEVADTSLEYDLQVKRPMYARAGVEELWVVDIDRRELRLFREPQKDYSTQINLTISSIAASGDVVFRVSALFPGES